MTNAWSRHGRIKGSVFGLCAAALFGFSTPFAKLLLPDAGPLLLAALLYLGAGAGLVFHAAITRLVGRPGPREAPLRKNDALPLIGIIALGGVLGPVLMLDGLNRVSAVAGALLLNLEAPFTIAFAVLFFGEHLGWRIGIASALVVGGAAVLGYRPGELRADWLGMVEIAAACACWGLDNNLAQRLSLRDPIAVARWKALGAGSCTLAVALLADQRPSSARLLLAALLVGAACYGLSIVLDLHALRLLGAAREATLFATSPFVGALAAVPMLGEGLGGVDFVALVMMAGGVALLSREHHSHLHAHDDIEHEHLHEHDEHHQHAHDGPFTEPHSHPHRHSPLVHEHPHVPDLHHRHEH